MALPQSTKAWQSAHTLNAHGTALSGNAVDVTAQVNSASVSSPTKPIPGIRPSFMTKSGRQGEWVPDNMVFIYNQLVNYEGSYRI